MTETGAECDDGTIVAADFLLSLSVFRFLK